MTNMIFLNDQLQASCPGAPEDWIFYGTPVSGYFGMGQYGHWREKTIEEKEMEEAIKEVNLIAPGWKE